MFIVYAIKKHTAAIRGRYACRVKAGVNFCNKSFRFTENIKTLQTTHTETHAHTSAKSLI